MWNIELRLVSVSETWKQAHCLPVTVIGAHAGCEVVVGLVETVDERWRGRRPGQTAVVVEVFGWALQLL